MNIEDLQPETTLGEWVVTFEPNPAGNFKMVLLLSAFFSATMTACGMFLEYQGNDENLTPPLTGIGLCGALFIFMLLGQYLFTTLPLIRSKREEFSVKLYQHGFVIHSKNHSQEIWWNQIVQVENIPRQHGQTATVKIILNDQSNVTISDNQIHPFDTFSEAIEYGWVEQQLDVFPKTEFIKKKKIAQPTKAKGRLIAVYKPKPFAQIFWVSIFIPIAVSPLCLLGEKDSARTVFLFTVGIGFLLYFVLNLPPLMARFNHLEISLYENGMGVSSRFRNDFVEWDNIQGFLHGGQLTTYTKVVTKDNREIVLAARYIYDYDELIHRLKIFWEK